MGKITKEEAQGILENYLVEKIRKKASTLEIRDSKPGDRSGIWEPDRIENCFIVHVPDDYFSGVGASRMIAISKETGEIVIDGWYGE